jgi:hypothetical protein
MRSFKVWNKNRTSSFNLSGDGVITGEIKGLGLLMDNSISSVVSDRIGKSYTTNRQIKFQSISMKVIFGHKSNAYTKFRTFMDFIADQFNNGFILEYAIDERIVYADVEFREATKSQKTQFNVFEENITWDRLTPWYEIITATGTRINVTNVHFLAIEPVVKYATPIEPPYYLAVASQGGTYAQNVYNLEINKSFVAGQYLEIDSDKKEIRFWNGTAYENAYSDVGHEMYAFLRLEKGSWDIFERFEAVAITVTYKKWVAD